MFLRPFDRTKLRHLTYSGNGDSKSFLDVGESNLGPCYEITKADCIGHAQKRVRLRSYKKYI